MFNYKEISEQLCFTEQESKELVDIMTSLVDEIKTTDNIISYWDNNCFRADTIEEVLDQFDIDSDDDIKEIFSRVFILSNGKLVVIGIGSVEDNIYF